MLFAAFNTVLWPDQASEFSVPYDMFFLYVTAVVTVGGLGVYSALIYTCFRFAKKDGVKSRRMLGDDRIELIWTVIPAMFFLSFFFIGSYLILQNVSHIPQDAPEIYVVGKQWMWKLQHPNGVREINELHIPVGKPVRIALTSEDVIHNFGIPAFRNKIDAVPGRTVSTWYKPIKEGEYWIFCDQYCGQGHSQMVGKVHVMSQADYEEWLAGVKTDNPSSNSDRPTDGTPAWEGQKLFFKLQCITCHNNTYDTEVGNNNTSNRAPNLEGLFGSKVPIQGGKSVEANHEYIYESIRNPMAKVRDGWKPIMPAFTRSQVSEEDMINLVSYIRYLKNGKLPKRTDKTAAPVGAPTVESPGAAAPAVEIKPSKEGK